MSELKPKILEKFKGPTLCAFATVTEEGKPRVRYTTPTMDENLTIWMATFANSRKISQIKNNPEVYITSGVGSFETAESWVQIEAKAEILYDECKTPSRKNFIIRHPLFTISSEYSFSGSVRI